jgi:ketoreductase RED2
MARHDLRGNSITVINRERRVALVTGSSSGIGAAVARRPAAAGIRAVVNSAHSPDAGKAVAAELPDAVQVQADVSGQRQAEELVRAAVDAYGRLGILVNNAGVTRFIDHADLAATSPEPWPTSPAVGRSHRPTTPTVWTKKVFGETVESCWT